MNRLLAVSLAAGILLSWTVGSFGQTTETPQQQVPVQVQVQAPSVVPVVVVNPPPPKTHLQAMADQKGALIVAGYTDVGTVQREDGGYVRITAAEYTNTATSTKQYGLLVFIHGSDASEREVRTYVDDDEIDTLLSSLDSMNRLDHTATQLNDFDARYRTRGDLEIANIDANGVREVTFHGVEISSTSGQEVWATTHFPLVRLADVAQYLTTGKQLIDKAKTNGNK
jgi:hypothetical protein